MIVTQNRVNFFLVSILYYAPTPPILSESVFWLHSQASVPRLILAILCHSFRLPGFLVPTIFSILLHARASWVCIYAIIAHVLPFAVYPQIYEQTNIFTWSKTRPFRQEYLNWKA